MKLIYIYSPATCGIGKSTVLSIADVADFYLKPNIRQGIFSINVNTSSQN